jgi:hypothetical protein
LAARWPLWTHHTLGPCPARWPHRTLRAIQTRGSPLSGAAVAARHNEQSKHRHPNTFER